MWYVACSADVNNSFQLTLRWHWLFI